MKIDTNAYSHAVKMALKVGFLESSEELKLYAESLYFAVMWGRGIDGKNRVIQENITDLDTCHP